MKTIVTQDIVEIWKRLGEMQYNDVQQHTEKIARCQPELIAYIMTLEDECETKEPGKYLFPGIVILQALLDQDCSTPPVTFEQIVETEKANIELFHELDESSSVQEYLASFDERLDSYNQKPLLLFVLEFLSGEFDEDKKPVDREEPVSDDLLLSLIRYKTVIDCLDRDAVAH